MGNGSLYFNKKFEIGYYLHNHSSVELQPNEIEIDSRFKYAILDKKRSGGDNNNLSDKVYLYDIVKKREIFAKIDSLLPKSVLRKF